MQQVQVTDGTGGKHVYDTTTWLVDLAGASHMNSNAPILKVTVPMAGGEQRVPQVLAEFLSWTCVELIDVAAS